MKRLAEAFIQEQLRRISSLPAASLLSQRAFLQAQDLLEKIASDVAESTVNHWIAQEALAENPLAAYTLDLLTKDQRERATDRIGEKLARGELALPGPLERIIRLRLFNVTEGLMEMLCRMQENKAEICAALGIARPYTRIEDMGLSAGDTHHRGRNVAVLRTDAGSMVYKPHDMRLDAHIHALVQAHFADVLGIPRCASFGDQWGVSEWIEKQRSQGRKEAALFWRRMGGAAAVIKLLCCTDMHIENLTCHGGKPYILDLETVLSPEIKNADYKRLHPELSVLKSTSPYLSGLLPCEPTGRQYSVLMNTQEDGCAPEADGKPVSVMQYLEEFLSGYDEIYRRILRDRDALRQEIAALPADLPVRLLIRNTQAYYDTQKKLYHFNAVESEEKQAEANALLARIMKKNIRDEFSGVVESELSQLLSGDIPYVYTRSGSRDLFSGGESVAKQVFERSAQARALHQLEVMGEADERFDLSLFRRSLLQYPALQEKKEHTIPARTDAPMTRDQAIDEAKALLNVLKEICILSPADVPCFGYVNEEDFSFRFCEYGLTNGMTGIAVFAAAFAMVSGQAGSRAFADSIVEETLRGLERQYAYLSEKDGAWDYAPYLGESDGLGGILTGLALLKRYTGRQEIGTLQEKALSTLSQFDLSRYGAPDRMIGMAGLLSALCRFPEYQTQTALIQHAADSLMKMKNLPHNKSLLWKPFPDKKRPISGGGHGLAGIAEALYAASSILKDEAYAFAARDAIAFEIEAYNEKFHTWSDFRTYPPVGYMHGYCSGAPGIGILIRRIRRLGYYDEVLDRCADLASGAVDSLPLNERDHLCCGNASIAEYYLTMDKMDEAGRVLGGMAARKNQAGSYRYMSGSFQNSVTGSLFYGVSGIGYEMLRFACPEKILSVL